MRHRHLAAIGMGADNPAGITRERHLPTAFLHRLLQCPDRADQQMLPCAQRASVGSAAGLRSISRRGSRIMRISVGRSGWCGPIVSSLATRSSRTYDGGRVWRSMRSAPKAIARCFMTIPRPEAETSTGRMLPPQRSSPANLKVDQNQRGSSGEHHAAAVVDIRRRLLHLQAIAMIARRSP